MKYSCCPQDLYYLQSDLRKGFLVPFMLMIFKTRYALEMIFKPEISNPTVFKHTLLQKIALINNLLWNIASSLPLTYVHFFINLGVNSAF